MRPRLRDALVLPAVSRRFTSLALPFTIDLGSVMLRLSLAIVCLLTLCTNVSAEVVLYDSQGFESPTFYAGSTIVGQDESNPWQRFGGSPAAFVVQSTNVASGAQAVQANGGGLNDGTFVWPNLAYMPEAGTVVRIQVDMARTLSANVANSSPVYAVDIYDDVFSRTSRFGLQQNNGVIRTFVSVPINDMGEIDPAGEGNRSEFYGPPIAQNDWVHFDFTLDYTTKTVNLNVDGVILASGVPFQSQTSMFLDSAELQVGTFNNVSADNGYFDNYVVSVQTIGDFDHDNDVDGDDLTEWRSDYGNAGDNVESDADFDGDTDGNDFLIWQRQLSGPQELAQAVPEPRAALMAILASLAMALRRRFVSVAHGR